jgi:hypothetical protein
MTVSSTSNRDALPFFRLGRPRMTDEKIRRLTEPPPSPPLMSHGDSTERWFRFQDGELHYFDRTRIWRAGLESVDFRDAEGAARVADDLLRRADLLLDGGDVSLNLAWIAGTRCAVFDVAAGQRLHYPPGRPYVELDQQVCYRLEVAIEHPVIGGHRVPVIGRGTTARVVVGPGDSVLGLHYGLREIVERVDHAIFIPEEESRREYRLRMGRRLEIRNHTTRLAYRRVAYRGTPTLWPVWVHSAEGLFEDDWMQLKFVTLSAIQGDGSLPAGLTCQAGGRVEVREEPNGDGYRIAAYWPLDATPCSATNATRFLQRLRGQQFTMALVRGDGLASVSDWTAPEGQIVDTANVVFYSGHADHERWLLVDPETRGRAFFTKDHPVPFGDQGEQSLDLIVISACGPMQDKTTGGSQDVFRWCSLFKGLHMLLGHGTEVGDSAEEGETFAEYCLAGMTVAEAWFTTACDLSGGHVQSWPGVLFPRDASGRSTFENQLKRDGAVFAEPPDAPTQFVAVWVPA